MLRLLLSATLLASQALPATGTAPPAAAQVMAIPDDLRAALHRDVTQRSTDRGQRLELLLGFMSGPDGMDLHYRDDATLTVAEAWQRREANCLTFTLVAVALAREAGLKAYGQEIQDTLAWREQDGLLYRSHHVNAGVRIGARRLTVDVAADEVISRQPPRRVDDTRLLAAYFGNRAVELIASGQPAAGLRHAETAIALDPAYPTAWSNAGVARMRNGDATGAERAYLQALRLDPLHPGALSNLGAYYRATGNAAAERAIETRLRAVQASDPFHQFLLGMQAEREGDDSAARGYYQRAIALWDGEHRFHFALARVTYRLGDTRGARRELARAGALSLGGQRALYEAKRQRLRL